MGNVYLEASSCIDHRFTLIEWLLDFEKADRINQSIVKKSVL